MRAADRTSVFISYSYESDEHNRWVAGFAKTLEGRGLDVSFDQHLPVGQYLIDFMERAISLSSTIILVCTPEYKKKFDGGAQTVGYEARLMKVSLLKDSSAKRFICIQRSGERADCIPEVFGGHVSLDCRGARLDSVERILHAILQGGERSVGEAPAAPVKQVLAVSAQATQSSWLVRQGMTTSRTANFLEWVLEQTLLDQFASGSVAGAWSIRYEEYMKYMYQDTPIARDVSRGATISYSAWVADALLSVCNTLPDTQMAPIIRKRLGDLKDYLRRHFDPESGAFGVASSPTTSNPHPVRPDVRHSAWALLTLLALETEDIETDNMLRSAAGYLQQRVHKMNPERERVVTFAILHRLIADDTSGRLLIPDTRKRLSEQRRIEAIIVECFSPGRCTWDWEAHIDSPDSFDIDNSLNVLYTVRPSRVLDQNCKNLLREAVTRLCAQRLVKVSRTQSGCPSKAGDAPNLATSALLLFAIYQHSGKNFDCELISRLSKFVLTSGNRNRFTVPFFPWQLAPVIHLALNDTHARV